MGPVSTGGRRPDRAAQASWYNRAREPCSAASSANAFPCSLAGAPDSRSMWAQRRCPVGCWLDSAQDLYQYARHATGGVSAAGLASAAPFPSASAGAGAAAAERTGFWTAGAGAAGCFQT